MFNLSTYIDHTLLDPIAKKEDIKKLCDEAKLYKFKSVCVHPYYVNYCKELLIGTDIGVCAVIGFPLGNNLGEVKELEAKKAIRDGADEIDMVINLPAFKNKEFNKVENEILSILKVSEGRALVKVIIETCYLSKAEIITACEILLRANVDYIKTSTGFGSGGANVSDIKLIKSQVGEMIGIKASGGIRDYKTAVKMIEAGATRLGTSSGIDIIKGQ